MVLELLNSLLIVVFKLDLLFLAFDLRAIFPEVVSLLSSVTSSAPESKYSPPSSSSSVNCRLIALGLCVTTAPCQCDVDVEKLFVLNIEPLLLFNKTVAPIQKIKYMCLSKVIIILFFLLML